MSDTGRIDLAHPDANMYGCLPCPQCKSLYRIPYQDYVVPPHGSHDVVQHHTDVIVCEECGFVENILNPEDTHA